MDRITAVASTVLGFKLADLVGKSGSEMVADDRPYSANRLAEGDNSSILEAPL
jgi:hypothetical protein